MMTPRSFSLACFTALDLSPEAHLTLAVLAGLLALALGVWLSASLVRRVWGISWKMTAARHYLHLRNNGNLPATLQVRAISPDEQLHFGYLLDGAELSPTGGSYLHEEPLPGQPIAAPAENAAAPAPAQPAGRADEAGVVARKAPPVAQATAATAAAAEGKANAAFGIAGGFALVLGTLGSLLPGSAGRAFSQKAAQLQKSVSMARFKVQAPVQKVRQAQRLRDQVDTLQTDVKSQVPARPSTAQAAPEPGGPPVAYEPGQASAAPATQGAAPGARALEERAPEERALSERALSGQPPAVRRVTFACQVVQLPPLPPEADLTLELRIEPRNRYRSGVYTYWLLTQAVEPAGPPAAEKTVRRVAVQRPAWIYWLLSVFLSASIVLLNAAWVAALTFWLARWLGAV